MKRRSVTNLIYCVALSLALYGCGKVQGESKGESETGPRPATVEPDINADNFKVDHPERFPLATAAEIILAPLGLT